MYSKKFAIISLIAVFILGLSAGIVTDRVLFKNNPRQYHKKYPYYKKGLLGTFTKELDLTPAQQDTLKALLQWIKQEHKRIRQTMSDDFKNIRKKFREDFAKVLNEEQKMKFNKFNERYDRMRKEHQKESKQNSK